MNRAIFAAFVLVLAAATTTTTATQSLRANSVASGNHVQLENGVESNATALRLALTQKGITWGTSLVKTAFDKYFGNFSLPNVTKSILGNTATIYDIQCQNISVQNIEVAVKEDKLSASVENVSTICPAKWKIDWLIGGESSGEAMVKGTGGQGSLDLAVGHDDDGHFTVKASDTSFDVGDLDIDIKGGGISGDILKLLEKVLHGWITKTVDKTIEGEIDTIVNQNISSILAALPTSVDLGVAEFKFGVLSTDYESNDFVSNGIQGYFVDPDHPSKLPPFNARSIPSVGRSSVNSSYVQLIVSNYMVESLFWVLQSRGLLEGTIGPDDLPPNFPLQLNTSYDAWKLIAPDLAKKYPDDEMHVKFGVQNETEIHSLAANDSFSVSIPVAVDFQVNSADGSKSAFTLGCPLKTSMTLSIKDGDSDGQQSIVGHMEYADCSVALVHSSVGTVNYKSLKHGVSFILKYFLQPAINKILNKGVPLPSFGLTNSSVTFEDDYAVIGTAVQVGTSTVAKNVPTPNYFLSKEAEKELLREFGAESFPRR